MTTHIEAGLLLALRDGEAVDGATRHHLTRCATCRSALDDARRRADALAELLGPGGPPVDVEAAKAAVRQRLDAERARGERRIDGFRHLRRAAAILAFTAGAAYAIPRSPIPAWLGLADPPPATRIVPMESPPETGAPGEQELLLVTVTNGIDVVIEEAPAGSNVELTWLPGTTARIAAGPGARYTAADGRVSATAPSGPIRIGIPRSASSITIRLNGRMVYRGTSVDAETLDVVRRSDEEIVFLVPDG
jgi:hypothetical protein